MSEHTRLTVMMKAMACMSTDPATFVRADGNQLTRYIGCPITLAGDAFYCPGDAPIQFFPDLKGGKDIILYSWAFQMSIP